MISKSHTALTMFRSNTSGTTGIEWIAVLAIITFVASSAQPEDQVYETPYIQLDLTIDAPATLDIPAEPTLGVGV